MCVPVSSRKINLERQPDIQKHEMCLHLNGPRLRTYRCGRKETRIDRDRLSYRSMNIKAKVMALYKTPEKVSCGPIWWAPYFFSFGGLKYQQIGSHYCYAQFQINIFISIKTNDSYSLYVLFLCLCFAPSLSSRQCFICTRNRLDSMAEFGIS